jgi:hypothetical protein
MQIVCTEVHLKVINAKITAILFRKLSSHGEASETDW